MEIKRFI